MRHIHQFKRFEVGRELGTPAAGLMTAVMASAILWLTMLVAFRI